MYINLGGGFKDCISLSPLFGGEDSHFDSYFFKGVGEKPPTRFDFVLNNVSAKAD